MPRLTIAKMLNSSISLESAKAELKIGEKSVPDDLLEQAENDPRLSGVVLSRKGQQKSITLNGEVIGFLTPRKERDGSWRTGAIYIVPDHRSKGYASRVITMFFSDKEKGYALIEEDNYSSQKAFSKAGFNQHGTFTDKSDGVTYQVWKK